MMLLDGIIHETSSKVLSNYAKEDMKCSVSFSLSWKDSWAQNN